MGSPPFRGPKEACPLIQNLNRRADRLRFDSANIIIL